MAAATAAAGILGWLMDIRFDEAFTLETTSLGPLHAIRQAIEFEQQAPLYFALLSLWRRMDLSIPFARLFSLVFYPLAIWLAAEAAKRYLKNIDPLIISVAFAVHQLVFWATLDIRLYTFITALSAAMLVFFYDGYFSEQAGRAARIAFIATAIAALYTQYYLGFQLAAFAAGLAVCGKWQPLRRYILGMFLVAIVFVPMAFVVVRQAGIVSGHTDFEFTSVELMREVYRRIVVLFISIDWVEPEWLKAWLVRLIMVSFGLLFLIRLISEKRPEDRHLAVFVGFQVAFFAAAMTFVGVQPLQARHMIGLVLPLLLIQFSAVAIFRSRKVLIGWLLIVVFVNLVFIFNEHKTLAKPGDFRRMAEYVMRQESPGEPVLIVHADGIYPFRNYYRGINQLDALPQVNELTSWNPKLSVFRDEQQIEQSFQRWPDAHRFWLVSDGWCAHGTLKFNCDILERYIDSHFVVVSDQGFSGASTVRLLEKR